MPRPARRKKKNSGGAGGTRGAEAAAPRSAKQNDKIDEDGVIGMPD